MSVSTKRLQLAALIKEHDIDIVRGCESHLDTSYFTLEVFPTNYIVCRKDKSIGGGVFVAIKDDLTLSHEPILGASAELVWAKLFIVTMKPLVLITDHPIYTWNLL